MDPDIAQLHDEFRKWDTPALSNALDALRLRPDDIGHTDGSLNRITGTGSMVGTAVTARMVARQAGTDAIPVSELHRRIADVAGPVIVVVEDADDPPGAGAFLGEVNGNLLRALGVHGFVTNGRVRDINELRDLGFPIHASGLCVARSYMRLVDVASEVTVGGLTVNTGDILHGDEHGILSIPPSALPDIVAKAEQIREDEQKVVAWSRSTDFTVDGLLALKRIRH